MAEYHLTNKAILDLDDIYKYTYRNWSENQADKYYFEMIGYFELLSENPKIGKCYEDINVDILGFVVNRHIIFYRIISSAQIQIVRILGVEMDLKSRIGE